MKKVASLVLCVALLLTLAACGIPEGMEEQAQLYQKYADQCVQLHHRSAGQ